MDGTGEEEDSAQDPMLQTAGRPTPGVLGGVHHQGSRQPAQVTAQPQGRRTQHRLPLKAHFHPEKPFGELPAIPTAEMELRPHVSTARDKAAQLPSCSQPEAGRA